MQITKNKVASIDYRLTDNKGELIDSSEGEQPLVYLHGNGALVAGLEAALEGKAVGDVVHVELTPDEAYGERQEELCTTVSKEHFEDLDDLEIGTQFFIPPDDDDGEDQFVYVTDIGDDTVTIDGNHPLAGFNLVFDVTIVDIREATPEEIDHGHAHGPDGDHHP